MGCPCGRGIVKECGEARPGTLAQIHTASVRGAACAVLAVQVRTAVLSCLADLTKGPQAQRVLLRQSIAPRVLQEAAAALQVGGMSRPGLSARHACAAPRLFFYCVSPACLQSVRVVWMQWSVLATGKQ